MKNQGQEEVTYLSGYLVPVEPLKGQFDIKREKELIAGGSHFFCVGHLSAVIIGEQSPSPNYCSDCYRVIGA